MNKFLKIIQSGKSLSEEEMMEAIGFIMDGWASNDDLAPFLTGLADRGETIDEIVGAAKILRERSVAIHAPPGTVDCCGTGGDGSRSYNISTAVALVVAACGVPVAKHGNRASSSKCGAADVLENLGVNLHMPVAALEEALTHLNFAFLLASKHHPAMKHVAIVRKKLGRPTIFNLLGPLSNPANAKFQLVGVYDRKWVLPMAEALKRLGAERAWVVHGADGLDEITVTDETHVARLEGGIISETIITPEDFGLERMQSEGIKGGSVGQNVKALRALLEGEQGPYRDIVLANASAVLNVRGVSPDLKDGIARAEEAIDSRLALQTLKDYVVFSREIRNLETEEA